MINQETNLKKYLEEICSAGISGVELPLGIVQERKVPGLDDKKIKKRIKKRKKRKNKKKVNKLCQN